MQSDDIPTAKPSTAPLPVPTKENDWLGFCQSAIKLQNGDRKVNQAINYAGRAPRSWLTGFFRVLLRREQTMAPLSQHRELRRTTAQAKDVPIKGT